MNNFRLVDRLCLFSLLFPSVIFAQILVAGQKLKIEKHNNGKVYFEAELDAQGREHGRQRRFYDNGKLRFETVYEHGEPAPKRIERSYSEEGHLTLLAEYDRNLKNGKNFEYYDNGKKKRLAHYKDDLLDGEEALFDDEGHKTEVNFYKADERQGVQKEFDEDGNLTNTVEYQNGVQHGWLRSYFSGGKLSQEVKYANGEMDGPSKQFWRNGKTKSLVTYKAGKKNGPSVDYWEDGSVMCNANYHDDDLDGLTICYDDQGRKRQVLTFKDGVLTHIESYNMNGKKIKSRQLYEDGSVRVDELRSKKKVSK